MSAPASVIATPDEGEFVEDSPGDSLIQRLDDPQIAASLTQILDHADLLAVVITGLDGMLRRADVIGDSLVSGVTEVRELAASSNGQRPWPKVDMVSVSDTVTRLSAALVDATPAVERLLQSPLASPQTAAVLADMGEALLTGKQAADADPRGPKGIFSLMKAIKDPDVSRGLGFMIQIARAFGHKLNESGSQTDSPGPRHAA